MIQVESPRPTKIGRYWFTITFTGKFLVRELSSFTFSLSSVFILCFILSPFPISCLSFPFCLFIHRMMKYPQKTLLSRSFIIFTRPYVLELTLMSYLLQCEYLKTNLQDDSRQGLCTNHVDRIQGIFDPHSPLRRHFYKIALIK